MPSRRTFLQSSAAAAAGLPLLSTHTLMPTSKPTAAKLTISLAQWSLHRAFFKGYLNPVDFPVIAKQTYGISAVEYVNAFMLASEDYARELKRRGDGEGVQSLLIMVDNAGNLGDPNPALRQDAIDRHTLWLDLAAVLGCHSIRVNARSEGSAEEQMKLMADGLHRLAVRGEERNLNVLIENHGGFSSHGDWVAGLIRATDHPNAGTLPDFGNWNPADAWGAPKPGVKGYDRYQGIDEIMPFARGVSAKTYNFDAAGNETLIDYGRMLDIVNQHGFSGYIGIEYEGSSMGEAAGIFATKALLSRLIGN